VTEPSVPLAPSTGGLVVHTTAGFSALAAALVIGQPADYVPNAQPQVAPEHQDAAHAHGSFQSSSLVRRRTPSRSCSSGRRFCGLDGESTVNASFLGPLSTCPAGTASTAALRSTHPTASPPSQP
jgi:hypothetical protein